MTVTEERISLIFAGVGGGRGLTFLSFHIIYSFASSAVACVILDGISDFEPSSVLIDLRY